MISWMQKHNKYLVWTIWIATIAFIGAGFVGWGSYNFGSKAGNVAKVGNVEIKQTKLNMTYSSLYSRINQQLQGKLDDKKAKELGLTQQAFNQLATQAKVLNFAQDNGIVVSDKEIADKIESIKGFQKDGIFQRETYDNYLRSQRLKAKDFESILRDEIIVQKTLSLLETDALPLEVEAIGASMNVADKLAYQVLNSNDINFTSDNTKVKSFWESQKEYYMTSKKYNLSFVWTDSNDTTVTEDEVKNYYVANSFKYTNAKGKQSSFNEAKEKVSTDLKLKNSKKSAQKAYIAFKKGELKSSENITLTLGDLKLTKSIWDEIGTKSVGDILKPKIVGEQYVTIKINAIEEPQVMTYDQAKEKVTTIYDKQESKKALLTLAESTLTNFKESNATLSNFVTLNTRDNLKPLNSQESLQFLQKLFTSNKEKGIISLTDKVVVYHIVEQKLLSVDVNQTDSVKKTVKQMKKRTFESNLLKMLDAQYPTEVYMGGLIN